MCLEYTMPTRKKRPKKKGKKIYNQIGCANQRGGSGAPILFSRTMYPHNTTDVANPGDARQTGGRRRYSRKYYKQSGGASYDFLKGPANYSDQPINAKYSDANPFRT